MKSTESTTMLELIEYSHSILKHAEAGEWEQVIAAEATRRQLINSFFSVPSNISDAPETSRAIRELLQLNNKLEKLTINERDSAKTEARTISKGRRAVNAYVDNAR